MYSLEPRDFDLAEDMVRFSAACGALVCSGAGAIEPQPSLADVQRFLSTYDA